MKKRVLVLHGLGGSDFPHWQSWLSAEVAKDYGCVSFPKLPDFNSPNKDAWMAQLIKELEDFKPDIVICHSLANILWFHVCNQFKLHVVEKLYLVAPPSLKCGMDELKSFYPCEVPKNLYAKASLLITSTNDNYMKKEEAISLQKMLNIPMKIMENAGHINASSGYGEWSWILEEITS